MTCPARAIPRASCDVKASPAADALRAPTIAIFERRRLERLPRTAIKGGAEAVARRSAG
jgi:hypothetical protein